MRLRAIPLFVLLTTVPACCLIGCGARGAQAENFVRALAHEISAADGSLDESAVTTRINGMYSQLGNTSDEKREILLEASCQAKDRWDLSQVSSLDDAASWVAGKSGAPAVKARLLLRDLNELQQEPTLAGSGSLTVDAVCAAA